MHCDHRTACFTKKSNTLNFKILPIFKYHAAKIWPSVVQVYRYHQLAQPCLKICGYGPDDLLKVTCVNTPQIISSLPDIPLSSPLVNGPIVPYHLKVISCPKRSLNARQRVMLSDKMSSMTYRYSITNRVTSVGQRVVC